MRIGEEFMEMKSINVIIQDVTKATVFGEICMLTKNGFIKSIGLKSLTEDTHVFLLISRHLNHFHSDQNIICPGGLDCCKVPFKCSLDYDLHQARRHCDKTEDGTFICPICQKPIPNHQNGSQRKVDNLLRHIRVDHYNHNSEYFRCNLCPKKFNTERQLKGHLEKHAKPKDPAPDRHFQCDKCENHYKTRGGLHTHIQSVHGTETYQCDKCEYTSKSLKLLENHHLRMHSTGQIVCDQCGKTFTNSLTLADHKSNSHGQNKQIQCTFEGCDLVFSRKDQLRHHVRRVHIGMEKLKKLKCGYCDKMFVQEFQRKTHEKKHLQIYDINCDICEFKTFSKQQLQAHKKRVHGNEEYFCDYPGCTKKYGIRENMYAHKKRVHKVHWSQKFN